MKTSDFYYDLPEELIAQDPLEDRSASRLLVLNKGTGEITHRHFRDIKEYLRPGDCLVINDTKVIPARLYGVKTDTGAAVELLLLKRRQDNVWETLVRPGKKCRPGVVIGFGERSAAPGLPEQQPEGQKCQTEKRRQTERETADGSGFLMTAEILDVVEDGNRLVRFSYEGIFEEILDQLGEMPLPPYITHKLKDKNRYQTVYARQEGSAAAPTAGLHFTPELLQEIREAGIQIAHVTLHVGLGTFRPVKVEDVTEHHMHTEYYEIEEDQAALINDTKRAGGRIICVGTTSCRTLESASDENGILRAGSGWTDIFIYPGYRFKIMDGLITNFHLPESTLIMLVSAFAGKDKVFAAYEEAVRERYRFFSFGDAMLIT